MKKKAINTVIVIAAVLIFLAPYLGVIYYTLPRNDEFACAFGIAIRGGYSLSNIIDIIIQNYMEWEGNYSGILIYTLLNPIIIGNSDSTVRFMNVICFIGFAVAWSYIIYRCLSFFDIEKNDKRYFTLAVLIISMNCRFLRETLGWFTGYMYYTIQLLMGVLGLFIIYDMINRKEKKKSDILLIILSCILEFLGAGGTLHVSAILCWVVLLLLVWAVYRKKEWIKAAILFGAIFFSTVLNVAAPGHRVRKDGYESISLFKGIYYTIFCVYNEIKRLSIDTLFPYIMLTLFIILLYRIKKGVDKIELHPFVVSFCGVACIVGSTFPVCYGYGKSTMASRGYEMLDLMIVIWGVLFLCSVVNYLKLKEVEFSTPNILMIIIMAFMMFTTVAIDNIEISDVPSFQCISGLADGSIKEYSDYWRDVLHQVERSEEKDLVIDVDRDHLERDCMIDRVMIQEDETDWVNTSMSIYYGHDTVKIRVTD
ncbi:MAG: hypothetical protein K5877_02135 [Lachnospiraceae bacterium]|nr:hypothetical protein [Lachnospiraceae bacterium]